MAPCAAWLLPSEKRQARGLYDVPWLLTRAALQHYALAQRRLMFNYATFAHDYRPLQRYAFDMIIGIEIKSNRRRAVDDTGVSELPYEIDMVEDDDLFDEQSVRTNLNAFCAHINSSECLTINRMATNLRWLSSVLAK